MATKVKNNVPKSGHQPANVPINTNYAPDVFSRIDKMKKDKGLLTHQEVIRLLVSFGLDKMGY